MSQNWLGGYRNAPDMLLIPNSLSIAPGSQILTLRALFSFIMFMNESKILKLKNCLLSAEEKIRNDRSDKPKSVKAPPPTHVLGLDGR